MATRRQFRCGAESHRRPARRTANLGFLIIRAISQSAATVDPESDAGPRRTATLSLLAAVVLVVLKLGTGLASGSLALVSAGIESSESISVVWEQPRTIILNEAAAWGADLIVTGSHGHNRFTSLLPGSVSEAVAMHAPCSVEVIRGK